MDANSLAELKQFIERYVRQVAMEVIEEQAEALELEAETAGSFLIPDSLVPNAVPVWDATTDVDGFTANDRLLLAEMAVGL